MTSAMRQEEMFLDNQVYKSTSNLVRDIHMDYIDVIEDTDKTLEQEIEIIESLSKANIPDDVKNSVISVISALEDIRKNLYDQTKHVVEKY